MYLLFGKVGTIAWWPPTTTTAERRQAYIAHRDVQFEGTDAVLAAALTRRMPAGSPLKDPPPPDKDLLENILLEFSSKQSWNSMHKRRAEGRAPPPTPGTSLKMPVKKLGSRWDGWSRPPSARGPVGKSSAWVAMRDGPTTTASPTTTAFPITTALSEETVTKDSSSSEEENQYSLKSTTEESAEWTYGSYQSNYNRFRMDALDPEIENLTMRLMEQACFTIQYRLKDIEYIIAKYEGNPRYRLAFSFRKMEDWERDLTVIFSYTALKHDPDMLWFWPWPIDPTWGQFNFLSKFVLYYSHAVRKFFNILYTREYIVGLNTQIMKMEEHDAYDILEYQKYLQGLNLTRRRARRRSYSTSFNKW